MVGWEYPPHNSGGLGVACEGICSALIESDNEVTLLLPDETLISQKGLKVFYCNRKTFSESGILFDEVVRALQNPYLSSTEYNSIYSQNRLMLEAGGFSAMSLTGKVESYRRQALEALQNIDDFDIIHAHDWLCFGAGIALKEKTGKPLVVHIHATEFDRGGGQGVSQYVFEKEKEGFEKADKIIAVSSLTKNIVVEKYNIPADKIDVVHNGVVVPNKKDYTVTAINDFKSRGNNIVLYLGRITIQKGVEYLVTSAKRVLEFEPNTIFVIAGSGDMEQQIVELAADLGISANILFVGFVRGEMQESLLNIADVLVMPSVSEPFGIVPLEALSHGTPVIISKQSGVAETVTHALKVDFWDTEELASDIISILRYDALKETLAKEGHKQVHTLNWKRAVQKIVKIYHSLIS
jgi:glycosyltransferase involved in cell wall biosynthesis